MRTTDPEPDAGHFGGETGGTRALAPALSRWVPLLAFLCVAGALVLTPLSVIRLGYAPQDDLLRDVAKAVSGRPWGDVVLLRPGLSPTLSTHAGWDMILGALRRFGLGQEGLLVFGMVALAVAAWLPGLILLRRAELLLLLLLVTTVLDFPTMERWLFGRPYLVDVACVSACLYLWERLEANPLSRRMWLALVLLIAVRVWIRSTVVMLGIPLAAVIFSGALTGRWRPVVVFAACLTAGVLLGTLMTGRPVEFLSYNVKHFYWTLFRGEGPRFVVRELAPYHGSPNMVLLALGYMGFALADRGRRASWTHPAFLLMLVGWTLSFAIARFWFEYGFPAMIVWTSLDLQKRIEPRMAAGSPARIALAGFCALAFGLAFVNPHKDVWSRNPVTSAVGVQRLNEKDPSWLPDKGGILYAPTMEIFYIFYYLFPFGEWKYATAMEAGFMRPEDVEVYENINLTGRADAYLPWLNRMGPADRMVMKLTRDAGIDRIFPDREWTFVEPDFWIGRTPRGKPAGQGADLRASASP